VIWQTANQGLLGAYFVTPVWPGVGSISFHPVITHITAAGLQCERCDLNIFLQVPLQPEFQFCYIPGHGDPIPLPAIHPFIYLFPFQNVYAIMIQGVIWETFTFQLQLARSTTIHPLISHNYVTHV
jgi:hypothetical protein